MKLAMLLFLLCYLVAGCDRVQSERKHFISTVGEFRTDSGNWLVKISDEDPCLSITRDLRLEKGKSAFEGTSSISPSDWINSEGYVVVQGPEDRIFAFDGVDRVWILERHGDGTRSWGKNFRGTYPQEFLIHLPNKLRTSLAEQDAAGQSATAE